MRTLAIVIYFGFLALPQSNAQPGEPDDDKTPLTRVVTEPPKDTYGTNDPSEHQTVVEHPSRCRKNSLKALLLFGTLGVILTECIAPKYASTAGVAMGIGAFFTLPYAFSSPPTGSQRAMYSLFIVGIMTAGFFADTGLEYKIPICFGELALTLLTCAFI